MNLEIPACSSTDHGEQPLHASPTDQNLPWWHRRSPRTPRTQSGRSPRSSTLSPIAGDLGLEGDLGWELDGERVGAFREDDDARPDVSLGELYRSVPAPESMQTWWKKFCFFSGPGSLIAVGYMDPGNWATDIAAGSMYNYNLLFMVTVSSLIAVFLQALSLRLGLVCREDLASACRKYFPVWVTYFLWVGAEIAITACDLAEVIGSAVAMHLLFGIPLLWGVVLTVADVLIVLAVGGNLMRRIEMLIMLLCAVIFGCFAFEMFLAKPDYGEILKALFVPSSEIVTDPGQLFVGIGILGATVMPHSLYLHSSLVQSRDIERTEAAVKEAIKFSTIDLVLSLFLAFFVNSAILIVAAATFHKTGHTGIADLEEASAMLETLLGSRAASVLFGVALLASGQQSTVTGTLAGQVICEGFIDLKLSPGPRRLVTRALAVVPAVVVVIVSGDKAINQLLMLSQVVLSFQLPFALVPLVLFTSSKHVMGDFATPPAIQVLAWLCTILIIGLNGLLIVQYFSPPVVPSLDILL